MKPAVRQRLDQAAVELGLAPTRSKAQQMIAAGDIEVFAHGQWSVASQASLNVETSLDVVRAKANSEILKYVSRGGLKLEGALKHLALDVGGWRCLDLGISTGGFTDCLLKAGAAHVCGIDVGHGQLHPSLKSDPRVKLFEGLNVKNVKANPEIQEWLKVDLCVADLSFISLLGVTDMIASFLPTRTKFLGLVKPQFELGAETLNKKGVVTDSDLLIGLENRVRSIFPGAEYFPSPIHGQDGNREFFVFATILSSKN